MPLLSADSNLLLSLPCDCSFIKELYQVFRAQADWTFILLSELPAKELLHLPRGMPLCGTMY
jgi:hypothetical protein